MILIYKPNKKVTDIGVEMKELKLCASLAGTYHCTCCGKDGRPLTQQSIELPFDLPMPLWAQIQNNWNQSLKVKLVLPCTHQPRKEAHGQKNEQALYVHANEDYPTVKTKILTETSLLGLISALPLNYILSQHHNLDEPWIIVGNEYGQIQKNK